MRADNIAIVSVDGRSLDKLFDHNNAINTSLFDQFSSACLRGSSRIKKGSRREKVEEEAIFKTKRDSSRQEIRRKYFFTDTLFFNLALN